MEIEGERVILKYYTVQNSYLTFKQNVDPEDYMNAT